MNSKFLFLTLSILSLCACSQQISQHNYFDFGARVIPHPEKVHKGGEDAYFANNHLLAVADGVSSWNKQGIDPSKYSKELCNLVGVILGEKNNTKIVNNPKQIITEAAKRNNNPGTSTLVVASLDKTKPILKTSYVGDSTYVIYRKEGDTWKVVFEAEGQQHSFNFPFQLGYKRATNPKKALEFSHEVQDKDILVVASDGVFDNMTSEQILAELLKFIGANDELKNAQDAAYNITETAFKLSLDKKYKSPFAIKSESEGRAFKVGGKSDDITAVVGQVRIAKEDKKSKENEKVVVSGKNENVEKGQNKTQEKVKAKQIQFVDL